MTLRGHHIFILIIFLLFCFISSASVQASEYEFDSEEFEGIESYLENNRKVEKQRKPTLQPTPQPTEEPAPVVSDNNDINNAEVKGKEKNEVENKQTKSFWIERDWTIEIGFASVILVYGIVYYFGSKTNNNIAKSWLTRNGELLRNNFYLIGYGKDRIKQESKHSYSLKATGRINCLGSFSLLELQRRQDLFSFLLGIIFPERDTITIDVPLIDMPPVSIAVLPRSEAVSFQKAQKDLMGAKSYSFETTKLSNKFVCISDTAEFSIILRNDVVNCINNNEKLFLQLYVTDNRPDLLAKKVLRCKFILPKRMEELDALMKLAFNLIDIVANAKLSKPGLQKAQIVREKAFKEEQKLSHQQRQEAAERKKAEKELKLKEKIEKMSPLEQEKFLEKQEKKKLKKKMSKSAKIVVA